MWPKLCGQTCPHSLLFVSQFFLVWSSQFQWRQILTTFLTSVFIVSTVCPFHTKMPIEKWFSPMFNWKGFYRLWGWWLLSIGSENNSFFNHDQVLSLKITKWFFIPKIRGGTKSWKSQVSFLSLLPSPKSRPTSPRSWTFSWVLNKS